MSDPIIFRDQSQYTGESVTEPPLDEPLDIVERKPYPDPIIKLDEQKLTAFKQWLDDWVADLTAAQSQLQTKWAEYEKDFRAEPIPAKTFPFKGASNEIVSAIAMAVEPVFARVETSIFKQDPVFTIKALKKNVVPLVPAITAWIDFWQKHMLELRRVSAPRILEAAKLGTCVFKTVYDCQKTQIKTYDTHSPDWKVITKEETRYEGPRVYGVSIGDFLFPPTYQHVQDCPIVLERQRTTKEQLRVAAASKKLDEDAVKSVEDQASRDRTQLESAREEAADHTARVRYEDDIVVYEFWCDYDVDGDGLVEHLVGTYHYDTRTLLQLRYNWYFHQDKPYTVIPYTVTNESLYGIGIAEMVKPFQDALTRWQQMASDNAYIANIRMFIAKKDSGIEQTPRLYAGRVFFVDDPAKDFIPFSAGEIYPSTLAERQNLMGLAEKRTGVSDYLTGRESPIVGSRATATSTLALIQEGTRRVEQVLENFRQGFADIIYRCIQIWIQYGLGKYDDIVFGDDEINTNIKLFFDQLTEENVRGAIAIDLTATDASANRQVMQQMQLQIIQIMMQYLEKLLEAGQMALQAQQMMPQFSEMVKEVMTAARKMFRDLLQKYDIRNPDDYLPDLEKYLNGTGVGLSPAGVEGGPGGPQVPGPGPGGPSGILPFAQSLPSPAVPRPAAPGSGNGPAGVASLAGLGQGV